MREILVQRGSGGWRYAVALIVAAFVAVGCGGRGLAKVKGRVTVAGKPVSSGTVMFYPEGEQGAVGTIGPDGSYTLTTRKPGDGAAIGKHKVAIHATSVGPGSMQEPKSLDDELKGSPANTGKILVAGKVTWLVPEKYSTPDQSTLTAEVKAGQNILDFDVPSK